MEPISEKKEEPTLRDAIDHFSETVQKGIDHFKPDYIEEVLMRFREDWSGYVPEYIRPRFESFLRDELEKALLQDPTSSQEKI